MFSLFDEVLVLSQGEQVYNGAAKSAARYFGDRGMPCPEGYNVADHLLDLASIAGTTWYRREGGNEVAAVPTRKRIWRWKASGENNNASSSTERVVGGLEKGLSVTDDSMIRSPDELVGGSGNGDGDDNSNIAEFIVTNEDRDSCLTSTVDPTTAGMFEKVTTVPSTSFTTSPADPTKSTIRANSSEGSYRASFLTQFTVLVDRSLRHLWRSPVLLFGHVGIALVLSLFIGALYFQSGTSLSGVQNRLGCVLFIQSLVSFGILESNILNSLNECQVCFFLTSMFLFDFI